MALDGLTAPQKRILEKNYRSFVNNFGDVTITRDKGRKGGLLIFYPSDSTTYVQSCENVDYANGWLYGVVQGNIVRGRMKEA